MNRSIPEAWEWYYRVVGDARCPIVDTWWQTETGGHLITPLPGAIDMKPGSASVPFFGVTPAIVDAATGEELHGACEGALILTRPWPAMMRSLYGDHKRFIELLLPAIRATTSPVTAPAGTRTVTTGLPVVLMMCSTYPATVWVQPRSNRR